MMFNDVIINIFYHNLTNVINIIIIIVIMIIIL